MKATRRRWGKGIILAAALGAAVLSFQNCGNSLHVVPSFGGADQASIGGGGDELGGASLPDRSSDFTSDLGAASAKAARAIVPTLEEELVTIDAPPVDESTGVHLYIDPRSGNDSNPGSIERPFKTISGAKAHVRRLVPTMSSHIIVNLRMGRYELNEPLVFTAEDSGKPPYYVIYQSYEGERGVISGGIRQRAKAFSWVHVGNGVYKANVGKERPIRQLYIKNRPLPRSRGKIHLNGSFSVTSTGLDFPSYKDMTWNSQRTLEVIVLMHWRMFRCPVSRVVGSTFELEPLCLENSRGHDDVTLKAESSTDVGAAWIENAPELITQSEEWAYDFKTGDLFFKPVDAADLGREDFLLSFPRLTHLIQVNGEASPVRNIVFRTLEFSHAGWSGPSEDGGYSSFQAGYHKLKSLAGRISPLFPERRLNELKTMSPGFFYRIPAAVEVRGGEHIVFTGNQFRLLGGSGLFLGKGTRENRVAHNGFTDIAATGLQVGGIQNALASSPASELLENNVVEGNWISRVGRDYYDNVGIFIGYTQGTRVLRNHLFNLPYTAISVGYSWTDAPTISKNIEVSENYVHDVMQWLSDGGGIYVLGYHDRLLVSGNHVRDILMSRFKTSALPFVAGLYFDNGARGGYVTQNQVTNIEHSQFMLDTDSSRYAGFHRNYFLNRSIRVEEMYTGMADFAPDNVYGNYRPLNAALTPTGGIVADIGVRGAYLDILEREPSPMEAIETTQALLFGKTTLARIRQALAESPEGLAAIQARLPALSPSRLKAVQTHLIQGVPLANIKKPLGDFDATAASPTPVVKMSVSGGDPKKYVGPAGVALEIRWETWNAATIETRYTLVKTEGCILPTERKQVWLEGTLSEGDRQYFYFGPKYSKCQMAICVVAANANASGADCVSLEFH